MGSKLHSSLLFIPAYCSGVCECLGSCVPQMKQREPVPKYSAAITATYPCRPACTLPSCSPPCCPPIKSRGPGAGGRGSPPAPPLSAAHWLRWQPPAGPVPVTASDLPSPALSERISGRSAAMERRVATAAARRGGGGGRRESLAPCRLAQRCG